MSGEVGKCHQDHGNEEGDAIGTVLLEILASAWNRIAGQHIRETQCLDKHRRYGQQPDPARRVFAAIIASLGQVRDFLIEIMFVLHMDEILVLLAQGALAGKPARVTAVFIRIA